MNQNNNKFTEELVQRVQQDELSTLLRDVDVPLELKQQLRQIDNQRPSVEPIESPISKQHSKELHDRAARAIPQIVGGRRRASGLVWLAAACCAGLCVGLASWLGWLAMVAEQRPITGGDTEQTGQPNQTSQVPTEPNVSDEEVAGDFEGSLELQARQLVASMNRVSGEVNRVLGERERKRLQSRLQDLNRRNRQKLQSGERTALILAIADQTCLPLGGPVDQLQTDLIQVSQKFPGTQGAAIADEVLSQLGVSN